MTTRLRDLALEFSNKHGFPTKAAAERELQTLAAKFTIDGAVLTTIIVTRDNSFLPVVILSDKQYAHARELRAAGYAVSAVL